MHSLKQNPSHWLLLLVVCIKPNIQRLLTWALFISCYLQMSSAFLCIEYKKVTVMFYFKKIWKKFCRTSLFSKNCIVSDRTWLRCYRCPLLSLPSTSHHWCIRSPCLETLLSVCTSHEVLLLRGIRNRIILRWLEQQKLQEMLASVSPNPPSVRPSTS